MFPVEEELEAGGKELLEAGGFELELLIGAWLELLGKAEEEGVGDPGAVPYPFQSAPQKEHAAVLQEAEHLQILGGGPAVQDDLQGIGSAGLQVFHDIEIVDLPGRLLLFFLLLSGGLFCRVI